MYDIRNGSLARLLTRETFDISTFHMQLVVGDGGEGGEVDPEKEAERERKREEKRKAKEAKKAEKKKDTRKRKSKAEGEGGGKKKKVCWIVFLSSSGAPQEAVGMVFLSQETLPGIR